MKIVGACCWPGRDGQSFRVAARGANSRWYYHTRDDLRFDSATALAKKVSEVGEIDENQWLDGGPI